MTAVQDIRAQDKITRFIFEDAPVRGEIVHLDESYREILKRHAYTLEVQQYLGEALVCASLLSATLKYQGSLILQAQGEGNLSLLLAQVNSKHEIRGLAHWTGEVSSEFQTAVGKGHLAITVDPGTGSKGYQGVVELKGENLARVVEDYFYQSEQLPTWLFLCADKNSAAGMLLQLMPDANDQLRDNQAKDYWEHIGHLARTITVEELLSLDIKSVLHRLFHQEKYSILAENDIKFVCRCSRDAMAKAISTLGQEEARKIIQTKQVISVTCEFCNKQLDFDRIDVERIFTIS